MNGSNSIDILFKVKPTGESDSAQLFAAAGQIAGDAFAKAFDQALKQIEQSIQRTLILTNSFGAQTGTHTIGGAAGANVGGFAAPQAPAAAPVNAFSSPITQGSSSAFPGSIYGYGSMGSMHFSEMSRLIASRAGNPFYGPNLDIDLATSEAGSINQARRAGVNIEMSGEQRGRLSDQRGLAREAIASAVEQIRELNQSIRDAGRSQDQLQTKLEELSKKIESGSATSSDRTELEGTRAQLSHLQELISRRDRLSNVMKEGVRDVQTLDEVLGHGRGMNLAQAAGLGGAALGFAGEFPSLARGYQVGMAGLNNMESRALMANDPMRLMAIQRLGGAGALRSEGFLESGLAAGAQVLGGIAGMAFGGPLGMLGGGALLANGARQFANLPGGAQGRVDDMIASEMGMNAETYGMLSSGREFATGAYRGARGLGSTGLYGFLTRAAGLGGFGASRRVGVGEISGMMSGLAGTMGGAASGLSDDSLTDMISMASLGVGNIGQGMGAQYLGGGDPDRASSRLKEVMAEAVAMGVDKSQMPQIMNSIAAVSSTGLGAAGAGTAQAEFMVGATSRMFGGDVGARELGFGQRAFSNVLGQAGTGGNYLTQLGGRMGLGRFGDYAKKTFGANLKYTDLLSIQDDLSTISPEDLAQLVRSRGGEVSDDQISGLYSHMMSDVSGGIERVGGMTGEYGRRQIMRTATGARTFREANMSGDFLRSMGRGAVSTGDALHADPAGLNRLGAARYDFSRGAVDSTAGGQALSSELGAAAAMVSGGLTTLDGNLKALNDALSALIRRAQEVLKQEGSGSAPRPFSILDALGFGGAHGLPPGQ
jgi:hypothetical protein